MTYETKTFNIPFLEGISDQTIKEHQGLYAGYVKHVNLIHEKIAELKEDSEKNAYILAEVQRRLGFEFGGMKNHEAYFTQFEEGPKELSADTQLHKKLVGQWGSFEGFMAHFRGIALTRGVGWAMLYHDTSVDTLVATWIDEQHIGQLPDVRIVLALDMWEHSYMLDYPPSEKKKYVDAFFKNLNWEQVAQRI